jgi:hypothetical protein
MALSKVNAALLATIVSSMSNEATPYHMVTEAEVAKLVKDGLVETNAEIRDGDKIAARATTKGIEVSSTEGGGNAGTSGTAPVATASAFSLIDGAELPASRGGRNRSVYPFDTMAVGQSFFVPASEAKPNPAKSLASTVSSANKRAAKDGGSGAKYDVRSVKSGVAYGAFTATSDGALVKRIA